MDREKLIHMVLFAIVFAWGYFAASSGCKAGELYVVSTAKSYHQDRQHGYNEKNLGIGLELHINEDMRLVAGEYKNSFYNKSKYFGAAWLPFHRWDLSAGALFLEVNGYDLIKPKKFDLIAIPAVSYNKRNLEINLVAAPPLFKMGFIGLQLGWKFFP